MSDSTDAPGGAPTPDPSLAGKGDFQNPEDDPEIAALLDFEPVPRKSSPPGAWTPEAQRKFIAWLAVIGSQGKACGKIEKDRGGATKLYQSAHGASFRAAWHKAIELYERRRDEKLANGPPPADTPPTVDGRHKFRFPAIFANPRREGQVLNEFGKWEDQESLNRRGMNARDNIARKLRMARRLYLKEISGSPGKRAAFEILTQLPIDWKKARRLEAQDDEPWRKPNAHQPDFLLTAENGWLGDMMHGPDKKAELREAIDAHRAKHGLEPVNWNDEDAANEL